MQRDIRAALRIARSIPGQAKNFSAGPGRNRAEEIRIHRPRWKPPADPRQKDHGGDTRQCQQSAALPGPVVHRINVLASIKIVNGVTSAIIQLLAMIGRSISGPSG